MDEPFRHATYPLFTKSATNTTRLHAICDHRRNKLPRPMASSSSSTNNIHPNNKRKKTNLNHQTIRVCTKGAPGRIANVGLCPGVPEQGISWFLPIGLELLTNASVRVAMLSQNEGPCVFQLSLQNARYACCVAFPISMQG